MPSKTLKAVALARKAKRAGVAAGKVGAYVKAANAVAMPGRSKSYMRAAQKVARAGGGAIAAHKAGLAANKSRAGGSAAGSMGNS